MVRLTLAANSTSCSLEGESLTRTLVFDRRLIHYCFLASFLNEWHTVPGGNEDESVPEHFLGRRPLEWLAAFTLLLGCCDELAGGGSGALLRSPFLFYVLGVLGNFVIDLFDFTSEVKILRILCVRLE